MEFIDNTGHVFSLDSYKDDPIIYRFKENDYIFWVKDTKVSINNFYIKPIRFIINTKDIDLTDTEDFKLNISLSSNIYKLIGPKYIQEKLENIDNINKNILINFNECKSELTLDDFYFEFDENSTQNLIVEDKNNIDDPNSNSENNSYYMFPFYIIARSKDEGTYLTNVLIKTTLYNEDEYTPITVGCTFIDECEELIINGRNMGISLPKEVIRAFYETPFESIYPDEKILRNEMKELLMNYMSIKGECGNFKSVLNSLKWFGWHNKISISKLLKTDNVFQDQYILDYFNIENDIKDSFKFFRTTNLISLTIDGNIETGEFDEQNFDEMFIGEGKPILEDLFKKNIEVIKDDISFYKPYYRFIFNELALKLDALKYYYQTYFLPVHIKIKRASINYKVYANTIKLNSIAYERVTESPLYISNDNIRVEFPEYNKILFCKTNHFVDENFNEFNDYTKNSNLNLYYINENCLSIPIKIIDNNNEYSEYEFGDYIKINDRYIKIYKLFKQDNEDLIEIDNLEEATHFRLSKYDETIYSFEEYNERYVRVSSGYYTCKLILSCISKKQSDTGHYVYIDGNYIYKKKFYSKYLDNIDNKDYNTIFEKENGSYIIYKGKCIKIDKENRYDIDTKILLDDDNFSYYQNPSQYYTNYVILPRFITNKHKFTIDDLDWLNSEFRISLLVNNKWFYYDFTIEIPSIYLELGKLEYQYELDEGISLFKQLKSLSPSLEFNSFMYQPDLVSIDTLFYNKDENRVISFLEKLYEMKQNSSNDPDEEKISLFYSKYYKNKIQIPYNKNFFNKIHLFDILDNNGNKIEYNGEPRNNSLYNKLFKIEDEKVKEKINIIENPDYDIYLMHDNPDIRNDGKTPYWYVVFISRYPIGNYEDPDVLEITTTEYDLEENYKIKYTGYNVEKFLVNRMNIIPSNGINHFTKNDMIVAGVYNNDYQFNIDLSYKWNISKISNPYNISILDSNTNLVILSHQNKNGTYDPGYYNIKMNYTINGLNDNQYEIKGIYMIQK